MDRGDALGAAFERLPGVLAGTVFLDPPTGPRVYLATAPEADVEALRDAVLGVLRDHGIHCPPDRIHLASPPRRSFDGAILPRANLDDLEIRRENRLVSCTVRLRALTRTTTGTAAEPDTRSGRARAAALATLRAAEALDPDLRLGLEGIRSIDLFSFPAVTLLVEATAGRSHAHLPGSAVVERSTEEAACMAVLAALRSWTV